MKTRIGRLAFASLIFFLGITLFPSSAAAQYGGFGKNKVQYRTFEFQVFQTEHFRIHYYPEERTAARRAARMAERCYNQLSRVLNHDFKEGERKPVILYSEHAHFQQTNVVGSMIPEGVGGITEGRKHRLVMPIDGSYEHFNQVLCHEVVHEFQYDIAGPNLRNLPRWFVEGMAEYLSKGRIDSRTHARMRDAAMSGYIKTIPEMNKDDGYLSYRFGEALWNYIGTVYGDARIGELLKMGSRIGANQAFVTELGVDVETLSQRWMSYLKEAYPSLDSTATNLPFEAPSAVARRVTDHEFTDDILPEPSYLGPSLSPDGSKVAYLSEEANDLYRFWDLWVASSEDGSNKQRLVKAGRSAGFESLEFMDSSPSWSPDGTELVFASEFKGRDVIYIYDLDSGDKTRIKVSKKELVGIQNPEISPDGDRILFTGIAGGESDLYLINRDGSNLTRLTNDSYADMHPSWSPDGGKIVFASDRGSETDFDRLTFSNLRVSVLDLETRNVAVLPRQDRGENTSPVWSPDGNWIAFVSDRSGVSDVYLWSLEESELYRLTKTPTSVRGVTGLSPTLSWARNSNELAFSYFEGSGYNIYVSENPQDKAEVYDPNNAFTLSYPEPERVSLYVYVESADGPHTKESKAKSDSAKSDSTKKNLPSIIGVPESAADTVDIPEGYVKVLNQYFPRISDLLAQSTLGLPAVSDLEEDEYKSGLSVDGICRPQVGGRVGSTFNDGIGGRSCIRMSDLLGDKVFLGALDIPGGNILHNSRVLAAYSNRKHRLDYGFSASQFPIHRFFGSQVGTNQQGRPVFQTLFVRDTYRSLGGNIAYPRSKFERFEASFYGTAIRRDIISLRVSNQGREKNTENLDNIQFVTGSLGWVYDNALPSFTHYTQGRRLRVRLQRFQGEWSLNSLNVDLRKYWNIDGRWSFATRLMSYYRFGRDSDRFQTYWGRSNLIRGHDFGSFSRRECARSQAAFGDNTPTGCPARDQLIGSSAAFFNAELRFPILNPVDTKTVGIPPLGGALFFDAGTAFNSIGDLSLSRGASDSPFDVRDPLMSFGAELRLNFGYGVLRFGRAWTPNRIDQGGKFYFSVWPSF